MGRFWLERGVDGIRLDPTDCYCHDLQLRDNPPQPRADALAAMMQPWQDGEGATAWPGWALSKHDAPRMATRWAQGSAARAQQLIALLAVLRGTVLLYQGEELGLTQSEIAFDDLLDPFGQAHWPRDKGRDGCRTPIPWVADDPTTVSRAADPGGLQLRRRTATPALDVPLLAASGALFLNGAAVQGAQLILPLGASLLLPLQP
jgi:glycosidase